MTRLENNSLLLLSTFCVLTFVVLLTSCYSSQEGCTDPESTNYNISADNLCEDCCQYPELQLKIFHENEDTTFNLKDTITNDLAQQVSLIDYVYLLSDFEIKIGEESFEVSDFISLVVDNRVETVKDDVIRVTRDVFTFDLGTIIYNGNTTELSFKAGLSDVLNENPFATPINDHALTDDPDSLYQADAGTYVFQRLKVAQGVDFLDTVIYDIDQVADILFSAETISERGEDKTIIIEAQYNKWFDGVDFTTMSKEDIESKIAQNTSGVFRQKD